MRCEECGFDWETDPGALAEQFRVFPARYRVPLARFLPGEDPDVVLRTRSAPDVWSVLEYAAHTRDAFTFYAQRIECVLAEDRPQLTAYDFDAACAAQGYNAQDPRQVTEELEVASTAIADLLAGIEAAGDARWMRVGIGSDGDERTVTVLARRAAHEGHHHLLDIGRASRHARGRA